jgi:pSer/pThr/pTyr-binding forkhead associated (FHA) protein
VYRGIAYPVNGGLLIGRAKVDERRMIVVDDASSGISRSHCEVAVRHGEVVVRDLSSYGTYVNEKRVSGEETLHPADVIRVGSPGAELTLVKVEQ